MSTVLWVDSFKNDQEGRSAQALEGNNGAVGVLVMSEGMGKKWYSMLFII